jgi:hypothetical protein
MSSQEKRSHKKLDPEIKALRSISRALDSLPDDAGRKRVMEWAVARGLGKSWISLRRFRWIVGARDGE